MGCFFSIPTYPHALLSPGSLPLNGNSVRSRWSGVGKERSLKERSGDNYYKKTPGHGTLLSSTLFFSHIHNSLFFFNHKMLSRSAARLRTNLLRTTKRYSSNESSGTAGSTVTSKGGFSDKEKAVENQWARTHVSKIKKVGSTVYKSADTNLFVLGCWKAQGP